MKIALAQLNPTIGDIPGNTAAIHRAIDDARHAGARLVAFPELAILGYPPKDLLLKPALIERCCAAAEDIAARCTDIAAIVGYACFSPGTRGRPLHNVAALCADGRIIHLHHKSLLPTYDVFDEHRYFEPGPAIDIASFASRRIGISICEDLWNEEQFAPRQLYHDNPIDQLAQRGADLFINCAASPFVVRKHAFRLRLMRHVSRKHSIPLLYCNQVGGNDELVFDGNSCAFDQHGNLLAHAKAFEEDLLLVDLDRSTDTPPVNAGPERVRERRAGSPLPTLGTQDTEERQTQTVRTKDELTAAYHALVLGLGDYCRKCGFNSLVLGLSGGIDSALCAALAVDALGADRVHGIAMPSRYSSQHSADDAHELARRLGIRFDTIEIDGPHQAFEQLLAPHFAGRAPDTTEENIQARIRGLILMAFSNKLNALLVTTGNKSEVAVGYCTLYGDMAGGLAVISDVPKTMVFELARWINEDEDSPLRQRFHGPVIPERTITKPPSAELRPGQKDQDSLPAYDILDQVIERYVERDQASRDIIAETGIDPGTVVRVIRMIDASEYKRKQMAPGLKITGRAFGTGRRMPLAQAYRDEPTAGGGATA